MKDKQCSGCKYPEGCCTCDDAEVMIDDAQHPARQKAIRIMEYIAEKLGKETIFDGELWYAIEDELTDIINSK